MWWDERPVVSQHEDKKATPQVLENGVCTIARGNFNLICLETMHYLSSLASILSVSVGQNILQVQIEFWYYA